MNKKRGNADSAICSAEQREDFVFLAMQRLTRILRKNPPAKNIIQEYLKYPGRIETVFKKILPFFKQKKKPPIISLFAAERVDSDSKYHPDHKILELADKIDLLCRYFPWLNAEGGKKYLSDLPDLPDKLDMEGFEVFAKADKLVPGDNILISRFSALNLVLEKIKINENGKFQNSLKDNRELRDFTTKDREIWQLKNFLLEEKTAFALEKLYDRYNCDFIFLPVQLGRKYCGYSDRLAADICAPEEFLLAPFEGAQSVLLNEKLIAKGNYLQMSCGGERLNCAATSFSYSAYFFRDEHGLQLSADRWRNDYHPSYGSASGVF